MGMNRSPLRSTSEATATTHWLIRALACASLTACGGGSEPDSSAQAVPAVAAASVGTSAKISAASVAVETTAVVAGAAGSGASETPLPTTTSSGLSAQAITQQAELDVDDPLLTMESGETIVLGGDGQMATLQGYPVERSTQTSRGGIAYDTDPGRLMVQYQGGDDSERIARVTEDPSEPGNHVLEFLIRSPNVRNGDGVPFKGRVQLNAYAAEALRAKELRLQMRMNLADGFEQLRRHPKAFRWLTLSEWWNDAGWTGQAFPFRITFDVVKPSAIVGSRLHFAVRAETLNPITQQWDTTVWSLVNRSVQVPTQRWVTLDYYFREGDANQGRFYLAMVPDSGPRVVLFDHRGWTHHPKNPAPDGLTHLNPAKLYTAKNLIDLAALAGHPLRVHWDNIGFRICRQRLDEASSPCAPAAGS